MKKSIVSILLLISLVFQTTYPLEGTKQRSASVKEAMGNARAVLKENWRCFISGTGPNCTKEQRSALGIISDFVSGKWSTAKTKLKKCLHSEACIQGLTASTTAVIMILLGLLMGVGIWAAISLETRQQLEKIAPEKNEFKQMLEDVKRGQATDEQKNKVNQLVGLFNSMSRGQQFTEIQLQNRLQQRLDILQEAGWGSTYYGKTLIGMALNTTYAIQFKLKLIEWFKNLGVQPSDQEALELDRLYKYPQPATKNFWEVRPE